MSLCRRWHGIVLEPLYHQLCQAGADGYGWAGYGKELSFTRGHTGFFAKLLMLSIIRPIRAATNSYQGVVVTVRWNATFFEWPASNVMSPGLRYLN